MVFKTGELARSKAGHVQVIHTDPDPLVRSLRDGQEVTDEQIKRFLKTFGGN